MARLLRLASSSAAAGTLLISLVVAGSNLGCIRSLAEQTSGRVGCPTSAVRISEQRQGFNNRTWTATCRGRRFYCTETQRPNGMGGRNSDTDCTESAESVAARERPPHVVVRESPAPVAASPAPAAPAHGVERIVTDGRTEFRARLSVDEPGVQLGHVLDAEASSVFVAVNFDAGGPYASCPTGFVIDGAIERLEIVRATPRSSGEQLVLRTSLEVVRRLASATHGSLRVCEHASEFGATDREVLGEFVRRIGEERIWRDQAPAAPGADAGR